MTLLVDAHAHLTEAAADALSAASTHFATAIFNLNLADGDTASLLLLAEPVGESRFRSLAAAAPVVDWQFVPTREPETLEARGPNGERLYLVAGRQIRTIEGLEVHALATTLDFEEGLSLDETLRRVRETDALAVIPWGVGKWFGERGRLVAAALARDGQLLLSDNGGRPAFWRQPLQLRSARVAGRCVLAGSDPLPIANGWRRLGSYGVIVDADPDPDRPAAGLRSALTAGASVGYFGRRNSPAAFVSEQMAVRFRADRFGASGSSSTAG